MFPNRNRQIFIQRHKRGMRIRRSIPIAQALRRPQYPAIVLAAGIIRHEYGSRGFAVKGRSSEVVGCGDDVVGAGAAVEEACICWKVYVSGDGDVRLGNEPMMSGRMFWVSTSWDMAMDESRAAYLVELLF